jgi:hypothetical protein
MSIREIEGSFELGDRSYRGKQKDVALAAGERLRAGSRVRMAFSDDRIVLLAPNTLLELRPEEKRLTLSLERGELIADLAGPGPELRVLAKSCEITPLGTAFGVKLENQKVLVVVERGRVEVKRARARAQLRAAEALQASEDGTLGAPAAADFRGWAWSRPGRAPELTLLSEKFASPERAEAVHRASEKPPLFEVPARGVLTLVCRADRPCRLKVQLFSAEARTTYKVEPGLLRGAAWRTLTIPFEDFAVTDKSRGPARLAPGSPITDLLLMPVDDEEKAVIWVDSIKATELRP